MAREARQQLAMLWAKLNRDQQRRRDGSYYAAVRFISTYHGGPTEANFQNDKSQRLGVDSARVDVVISRGEAFVGS